MVLNKESLDSGLLVKQKKQFVDNMEKNEGGL